MDMLFNKSMAGISLNKQVELLKKTNNKNIKDLESEIKLEDENINSKKNILNDDELKKKISVLNDKIKKYQNQLKQNQENLKKKKNRGNKYNFE